MVGYKEFIRPEDYMILEKKSGNIFEGDVMNFGQDLIQLESVCQYYNHKAFFFFRLLDHIQNGLKRFTNNDVTG